MLPAIRHAGAASYRALRASFSAVSAPASAVFSSDSLAADAPLRDLRRGIDARGDFRGAGLAVPRPPKKVAAAEAALAARVAAVTAGLESQAKRRADYKKTLPAKTGRAGLLQYVKKNAWEKE
jgi:hypothetical protein